jgi:hypothetical protein
VGTGWIAAASALPDSDKELLATGEAPATIGELWFDASWLQIFGVWGKFGGGLNAAILPALSTFAYWGMENWGGQTDGTMAGTATAGQVREAYNSWFANFGRATSALSQATQAAAELAADTMGHPDSDFDEDIQEVAAAMWEAAWRALEMSYESFREDVASYGETAAERGGELLEKTMQRIHDTNRANMTALPDRYYMDLKVFNWGGTVAVVLGDHDMATIQAMGSPIVSTDIAKKRGLLPGSGDWIVPEPGAYLDWIKYEIKDMCGSPKSVKQAPIPDEYSVQL